MVASAPAVGDPGPAAGPQRGEHDVRGAADRAELRDQGDTLAGGPVPLIIYNIPHRTGQAVRWPALRRLADLDGISGVKQAVGGIDEDTVRLMANLPDGFAVLAGDDLFASGLLALGAAGATHTALRHATELIQLNEAPPHQHVG
jgi:Dihydrodipicolinate synthetase family